MSVWVRMHVWGGWVHQCIHPLLNTTPAGSPQSNGANKAILSQKVYGELVVHMLLLRNVRVKRLSFSADRLNYLKLFRKHVSKRAAGKGRAVLEGVWLDAATIEACFRNNPLDEEAAVQAGLVKWVEGTGRQPPTWGALLEAMEDAEIAQEHFLNLKTDLGLR